MAQNPNYEDVTKTGIPHPNCSGGMPCNDCKPILDVWRTQSHAEWLASLKRDRLT